jgi:hypothetical protein
MRQNRKLSVIAPHFGAIAAAAASGSDAKKTGPSRMGPDKSEHGFKWNVDLSF